MTKIFVCISLLSALSIVEMKALSVKGHVGEDVAFKCSNWNTYWSNVRGNVKYFCHSPCDEDKHVIIKADFEKIASKDRIQITNTGEGLSVTFRNLKKSDSKKYYCGVERSGPDTFIEVNLKVLDAELPVPKTSAKPVTVGSTVSSAVTNSSTVTSSNNITTDMPVVNSTSSVVNSQTMQRPESLLYLIIGFVAALVTLVVLLTLMRSVKRQQKVVSSTSSPHEVTQGDVVYEDIDLEEQHSQSRPVRASAYPSSASSAGVDPDSLYANYAYLHDSSARSKRRDTDAFCEVVYSLAEHPKKKTELNGQSESYDNDPLYSLAQSPWAT